MGDSVWLHNIRRKKGRNPKLDCPWEGPYLVVSVLSDVTYRIQRSRRAKPKVIHADRLKPYLGPALKSWIVEGGETVVPVPSPVVTAEESEPVIPGGSVSAELREGHVDGCVAMESPNPAVESILPVAATMSEKAESDAENSDTGLDTGSEADVEMPSAVLPVVDSPSSARENLQWNSRSRHGREQRIPQRYGDWV